MGSLNSTIKKEGITAADVAVVLTNKNLFQQRRHQLTIVPAGGATGNVTVSVQPIGSEAFETLYESDGTTPRAFNLANGQSTIAIGGTSGVALLGVKLSVSGITGTFDAALEGW